MDNSTENRGDEKYIYVRSEDLLYLLSDSGNLDQLEEIVHEKKYKFRVTPDVKEVCDKFFAEKEAEKMSKKNAVNNNKANKGE